LEAFQEQGDVAIIERKADALDETLVAMRAGRQSIYQARLERGDFAGWAEFLIRVDGPSELGGWHYEV
jgi:uncharacterized protein